MTILIEWTYGRPINGADDDAWRAQAAAERVLDDAYVGHREAESDYRQQLEQFDDERPMTGLARLWIEARSAADIALTSGWHNPNGASCDISAY